MVTTAVITGDIINSAKYPQSEWLPSLGDYLSQVGNSPVSWEVYRGDEFQVRVAPETAIRTAIRIKAVIKSFKGLDVRMGIGLGEESHRAPRVSESNGTAYQRSGRTFESLKIQKINLGISSGVESFDRNWNLILQLALEFMDSWSTVSAEIITLGMEYPEASQREIAGMLSIKQSAVSQRIKRARRELLHAILERYAQNIKDLLI